MSDIFICYSRTDSAIATQIEQGLLEEGWSVFCDWRIDAGHHWTEEIESQLAAARAIVVVWSSSSIHSRFVDEAHDAPEREIIFPVRIEETYLPSVFRMSQTQDLIGWDGHGDREEWRRLVSALRKHLNGETAVPVQPVETIEFDEGLTPEQAFERLRNMATQTHLLPTLYSLARTGGGEYFLANHIEYFDSLVEKNSKEVEEILSTWIAPNSPSNLKFLASDFIGKYKLKTLAFELKKILRERFPRGISHIENEDIRRLDIEQYHARSKTDTKVDYITWVLNYLWAWSRCEEPMYKTLGDLLIRTGNRDIQKWILFVPRQMPDREWCEILDRYLHHHNTNTIKDAARALAALKLAGHDNAEEILRNAIDKNEDVKKVRDDIIAIWRENGLNAEQL